MFAVAAPVGEGHGCTTSERGASISLARWAVNEGAEGRRLKLHNRIAVPYGQDHGGRNDGRLAADPSTSDPGSNGGVEDQHPPRRVRHVLTGCLVLPVSHDTLQHVHGAFLLSSRLPARERDECFFMRSCHDAWQAWCLPAGAAMESDP